MFVPGKLFQPSLTNNLAELEKNCRQKSFITLVLTSINTNYNNAKHPEAGLLNKSSDLAVALGVTKFIMVIVVNLGPVS